MSQLEEIRERLDLCDKKIVSVLEERMDIIKEIMVYKKQNGLPILQPEQEKRQRDVYKRQVKSFATKEAVSQLKETNVIGENTLVMSLQNGLGNEETIAEVVGEANVISGKTYVGGRLLSPGYVSAGVKGKYTYIGELTGEITDRIQAVCDEFNKAGLLCEVSDNIKGLRCV